MNTTETKTMRWTLQVKSGTSMKWSSRIQCEDKELLERHAATLGYSEMRIVELPYSPEYVSEDRRGRRRHRGVKQWSKR